MKVQLQGQRVRLRISEAELARLQAGETVENVTRLPAGLALRQWLRLAEGAQPVLQVEAGDWGCLLPRVELASYVARLPCREGLRLPLAERAEEAVVIDLEVDVRDSVRSRGVPRR